MATIREVNTTCNPAFVNVDGIAFLNAGVIPSAFLFLVLGGVNGDQFTIAGKVFRFVNVLGSADATIQIKVSGTLDDTLADSIAAVNGTPNVNVVQSTMPFTTAVVALASLPNSLFLELAMSRGGTATPGVAPDVPLTATMVDGSSWSVANLNESPGVPVQVANSAESFIEISAQMAASGVGFVHFPFAFRNAIITAYSVLYSDLTISLLQPKYIDEIVVLFNSAQINELSFSIGFGATPLVVGDRVYFRVSGS